MTRLKLQITYRDNFMEVSFGCYGRNSSHCNRYTVFTCPPQQTRSNKCPSCNVSAPFATPSLRASPSVVPTEERDRLLKQITELQTELEEAKNSVQVAPEDSLLRGEETKDIVR